MTLDSFHGHGSQHVSLETAPSAAGLQTQSPHVPPPLSDPQSANPGRGALKCFQKPLGVSDVS